MKSFPLPDLGEGLQEAEIVAWHVNAGDHVVADQPLVSVETDKAVVAVPSPQAGRIAHLCARPGDRIKVGAPLVEFEEAVHADTGSVVGELPQVQPAAAVHPPAAGIKAVPAVRALARTLGVDLASVIPTGPDGALTRADVEQAARALAEVGTVEALQGVRRSMALNMARAGADVVPATLMDEADIEVWPAATDVTIRLIRALIAGCTVAPALNAWYDGQRLERRLHHRIDLGIAVDTEDGLFVPVLRDVSKQEATELRHGLDMIKAAVQTRRIPLSELRGQTITLSNFGMLTGRHAALVIVPPQVAILGAGRIAPRVVAVDGQPVVHRLLPLSLSFDHRAVTGNEAARFLSAVIADLERPD
jgi:pyruvate dehydrogenase E2 component (dihydrolipoamide acetyltransferase)